MYFNSKKKNTYFMCHIPHSILKIILALANFLSLDLHRKDFFAAEIEDS